MTDSRKPDLDLDNLAGYLGYQLRQAQAVSFRNLTPPLRALGITPGEFSLLSIVDGNPGVGQHDLVQVYRLDKSTLSVAVAALVRRELIRQQRDRGDRRRLTLHLTDEGCEMLGRATRIVEDQERRMAAVLAPGERDAVMDALRRIVAALEAG